MKKLLESGSLLVAPGAFDTGSSASPNPARGESVVAFADASAMVSPQEIRDFVRERAASFKGSHHMLPRTVRVPHLARSKVTRHRVVEEARVQLSTAGAGESPRQ